MAVVLSVDLRVHQDDIVANSIRAELGPLDQRGSLSPAAVKMEVDVAALF
jgi:hypothetical protein